VSQAVFDALRPAYHIAVRQPGDLVDNMVRAQTKLAVRRLKEDHLLRELIVSDGPEDRRRALRPGYREGSDHRLTAGGPGS
jgi:hypothetical protein